MKIFFLFVCLFFLIFPSYALADVATPTIGDFKNGYALYAHDSANFDYYTTPNTSNTSALPEGFKYTSEPVDVCLYPLTDLYYGAPFQVDDSMQITGYMAFSFMTSSPAPRGGYYVSTPCIHGKAYQFIPSSGGGSACDIIKSKKDDDSSFSPTDVFVKILPKTPDNLRLPTLIANMGGQGSLAGNFAVEIYSAAWQYFAIIAFIKFYKLIPGKMT